VTIQDVAELYDLSQLPEPPDATGDDDPTARTLIVFTQDESIGRVPLTDYLVSLEDARRYCSRDDTHGEGWFVGFEKP